MKADPFFGGPTFLALHQPVTTNGIVHPSANKAKELHQLGYSLRQACIELGASPELGGRTFASRTATAQGQLLFNLLITPREQLGRWASGGDAVLRKLADSVLVFRDFVPLIPQSKISVLTTTPDVQRTAMVRVCARWEAGTVSAADLCAAAVALLGAEFSKATPEQILAHAKQMPLPEAPTAPMWVFYGQGSESKAYRDNSGFVYKVAPVNAAMLDIPPIRDDTPLYPRIGAHLFSNALGQIPILERGLAASSFSGLAPTELVALTDTGDVVFKQVDYFDKEPTAAAIRDWAQFHGHAILPSQGEDPQKIFDNDTSVLPVVTGSQGQFHLILDLNPRNCRVIDGEDGPKIVPFDVISRPLLVEEIVANPQISKAVDVLRAHDKGNPIVAGEPDI